MFKHKRRQTINITFFLIQQILLTAREMKRFGNNYFTDKQLENAIHAYSQSVGQYDIFEKKYPEEFAELTEERAVLYCNLALTLFKMGHYADSANVSTQALALNPNSYKVNNDISGVEAASHTGHYTSMSSKLKLNSIQI